MLHPCGDARSLDVSVGLSVGQRSMVQSAQVQTRVEQPKRDRCQEEWSLDLQEINKH